MLIRDGLNFDEILVSFYWWNMTCMLTRCEYDKWSNWWCHIARMNYYASVLLYEFKILSSKFSLAWLHNSFAISWHQPIITYCYNFVDDPHSRWGRHQPRWQWWWFTTTTITFYEWVFSHNSWEISEQWKIHCASLRRTLLMPISRIKGLNQISIAHSRPFKTPSLLSSKKQKNRPRWMSG